MYRLPDSDALIPFAIPLCGYMQQQVAITRDIGSPIRGGPDVAWRRFLTKDQTSARIGIRDRQIDRWNEGTGLRINELQ